MIGRVRAQFLRRGHGIVLWALALACAGNITLFESASAQTAGTGKTTKDTKTNEQKSKDNKETGGDTKADSGKESKPAGPEQVDCIIYMQYNPDRGSDSPGETIAPNRDIEASAKAIGGSVYKVDATHKFSDVFASIRAEKKCCKKLHIAGHGAPDGSIDLPYENDGVDKNTGALDKENMGASSLGGPKAKTGDGTRWLDDFADEIKGRKAKGDKKEIIPVLCPDPAKATADDTPTVVFDTCWSAVPNTTNIAEQLSEKGIRTQGYTHSCKFPHDEKTGAGFPPTGDPTTDSKLKTYERGGGDSGSGSGSMRYEVPRLAPGTFYVSQNDEAVCTYDPGTPKEIAYTPIRSGSPMIATSTPPAPAATEAIPATPTTPSSTLPSTNPPPAASSSSDTPPTSSPVTTTTDITPPPPPEEDEVETYDKETVEQDGRTETGGALQGQMIMLATAKPDLTRTAEDAGSASDPAKCVTGEDGHCVIRIRRSDRAAYGLPDSAAQPARYALALSAMKHSGGIADITGKSVPSDLTSALAVGAQLAIRIIKIGKQSFIAFDFAVPYNHSEDVMAALSRLLGVRIEIDPCDDDKPAAPWGSQGAASARIGQPLPSAMIRLRKPPISTRAAR